MTSLDSPNMDHQGNGATMVGENLPEWQTRLATVFNETFPPCAESAVVLHRLLGVARDVQALYDGQWDSHEACGVGYHTLDHAIEVTLATARILSGWNKTHETGEDITQEAFLAGSVAALFHDAGYLKDKGDLTGTGGKHAFIHVKRGIAMARDYLTRLGWPPKMVELTCQVISVTEFTQPVVLEGMLAQAPGKILACALGTGDLVAQMADAHYMDRLLNLYEEFSEAYDFEGRDELRARGMTVFGSAEELRNGTMIFFERFVVPRLEKLGGMYHYLSAYFGGVRNPYMESIAANLYCSTVMELRPWHPIGELLVDMGMVSSNALNRALERQKTLGRKSAPRKREDGLGELVRWINHQSGRNCLGDVLISMGELHANDLRHALEEQMFPSDSLPLFKPQDFPALMRVAMLLSSLRHIPHVFNQVLAVVTELLDCAAASLLLLDERVGRLVIVVASGPNGELLRGQDLPQDMGIAGWVFSNGRAAKVNDAYQDDRFFKGVDSSSGFTTQSLAAVPLLLDNTPIGVLEMLNKHQGGFDERDIHILRAVAQMVAGSLDGFLWMMENGIFSPGGQSA
ncbi:MAG: GAF domain-containing protein [Magnetococcales bacterium]|nr:GAF domain-containing protein [Magnetococcales bacterium]NGZ27477.1 GAF domain-containing protein [Magnetococcales bacterium]